MSIQHEALPAARSYYEASVTRPAFPPAPVGPSTCDVCVVGGGYSGLAAALELAERGLRVILLEARTIGWGASGRNGGQVIAGYGSAGEAAIERQLGTGDAIIAWDVSVDGVRWLRERIGRHEIDCEWRPGYLSLAVRHRKAEELRRWMEHLERAYGYPQRWIGPAEIGRWVASRRFCAGVHDPFSGHLHPPVGTYLIATAPMARERADALMKGRAAASDTNTILDYFRVTADNRLVFGSGETVSASPPRRLEVSMRALMLKVFPQLRDLRVDYAWGGLVDLTRNRAPHFGRIGSNVYFIQGFSGHGVALAGIAGRLAAEAIAGQSSRFDVMARLRHQPFPGGRALRVPALAIGLLYQRLRDLL